MGWKMSRAIVNVATGRYVKGQERLRKSFEAELGFMWADVLPGSPTHEDRPYAFKAYALKNVADMRFSTLLWCDACIVPGARPLSDLWDYIEENGVWLAKNGWSNYEWTADSAYPALFSEEIECFMEPHTANAIRDALEAASGKTHEIVTKEEWINAARWVNKHIPHVVATAFGISLKHPKGRAFLDEYYRLASETTAFCVPWINSNYGVDPMSAYQQPPRRMPCGPADVRGHRHDQTAASVIAWRLGIPLTECPEWFSYRGGETEKTCLIADGAY